MPRRIDPLEARRKALIEEVLWVVTQLEQDYVARPWLLKGGSDPDLLAAGLRRLQEAARVATLDAERAGVMRTAPSLGTAKLLEEVAAWQREARLLLRRAGASAPERRAAGALRDALKVSARRLAGSLAMLRAAIPMLRADAQVLGPRVEPERLADLGEALLVRLEANQLDHNRAVDERAARVAAARAAVDALRRELRVIRWAWRMAWELSGRKIRRLDLGGLAADVGSRPRRRRGRRGADEADPNAGETDQDANEADQDANEADRNANEADQDADECD